MLIGKKMTDELNAQVGREYGASMQYVAMAAWLEEQGFTGFASFFHAQADEERGHGRKIVDYLGEVGGRVDLPALPKPRADYGSVEQALEHFLELEEGVTRAIYSLVELAVAEKDHSANQFLQWYVKEQREEVSSARGLLDKARAFGAERIGILDGMMGRSS
jgi:ferritin